VITTQVRPAEPKDHKRLSDLIFLETRSHRHLDWRSPLEWLGSEFFWMVEEGTRITAALACPTETDGIAWVRLFVHSGYWSAQDAWNVLWDTAKDEIAHAGGAKVAAIVQQSWFEKVLAASGFETRQRIVMLEWQGQYQPWAAPEADGFHIRKMTETDLPAVEILDLESFGPLWHNSLDTLKRAFAQSLFATVAENEDGIVGYQMTTGFAARAHLARLAVRTSMQGRGIGRALLGDLFAMLKKDGFLKLTVNTQSDNENSLSLYRKTGFIRTGEEYPVYTFDVPAVPN